MGEDRGLDPGAKDVALAFVMVDSPERTEQLWTWLWRLTAVLVVWFASWPLWASLAQPARSRGPR